MLLWIVRLSAPKTQRGQDQRLLAVKLMQVSNTRRCGDVLAGLERLWVWSPPCKPASSPFRKLGATGAGTGVPEDVMPGQPEGTVPQRQDRRVAAG